MRIDGKRIQEEIKSELKEKARSMDQKPSLAVICVGEDPASAQYVKRKQQFGQEIGIRVEIFSLSSHASTEEISEKINKCAEDKNFSAMIVQLPLPKGVETQKILDLIPIKKDVDVLSSAAYALFEQGNFSIFPPTVGAIREILKQYNIVLQGRNVVVVGHGRLVGAPVASWLKREGVLATIITKETNDISKILSQADIIISGAGAPHLITPTMIKEGVVLVDAGTSEVGGKIAGDFDPTCEEKASVFTPVPGGVGPLTVAILFKNVIAFAERKVTI